MPVKITDLQRDKRSIEFMVNVGENEVGEALQEMVKLTYRPSAYTGKMERELNELQKGEWKSALGITFLQRLIIEWDVEDVDGTPFPMDTERLAELPSPFIGEVITGIADDMGKSRRG